MPLVRVFLLTYERPRLLPRALESLRRQTFSDWVCEVHNGSPQDPGPAELLSRVGDSRFRLVLPPRRTGPVEAFNLAHRPAEEPYQSILEDDNWWEPEFLEKMAAALDARPEIDLAWSNMRVWNEGADGGWTESPDPVWKVEPGSPPRLFSWPQLVQFDDRLYSNGAMLLRSRAAASLEIPSDTLPDMIEDVRERAMRFPIMLVPEPLVHFSITLRTFRSSNYADWGRTRALLGASFLATVPMTGAARRRLWAHRRALHPRSTNPLFFAALLQRDFGFLADAGPGDWLAFVRGCVRRPRVAREILSAKRRFPAQWRHLRALAAARTAEARRRGFVALGAESLLDPQAPGNCGLEYLRASS